MYGGGAPSSSTVGSPYYYGYSLQTTPRIPTTTYTANQAHINRLPSYLNYPAQGEPHFSPSLPSSLNPTLPKELAAPSTGTFSKTHKFKFLLIFSNY